MKDNLVGSHILISHSSALSVLFLQKKLSYGIFRTAPRNDSEVDGLKTCFEYSAEFFSNF